MIRCCHHGLRICCNHAKDSKATAEIMAYREYFLEV